MRVCNVVKNSVWYDPRVRKQLYEYTRRGIEVVCVGVKDIRCDPKEVDKLPCKISLVDWNANNSFEKTLAGKILRELNSNQAISREIINAAPDLIHANDLNALIPAYFASKKLNCKLVYDTHEIFLENPWIARNKFIKFVWGLF